MSVQYVRMFVVRMDVCLYVLYILHIRTYIHLYLYTCALQVKNALTDAIKKAGLPETMEAIFSFFVERVRNNLHIVLCMSPVGDPFRDRLRQYPAFVNCTTIDWFTEWPKDALLEVAEKYMEEVSFSEQESEAALRKNIASVFVTVHRSVAEMSERMLSEMKRYNYVTPTNYLELVTGYKV